MTQASLFRVGVIGPWSCDPLFAKALPRAAAQLAVERINRDDSLSLGVTFDYVILEEDCQTSRALRDFLHYDTRASGFVGPANPGYYDAASQLGQSWNKAVFSWSCVGQEPDDVRSRPTVACTTPSPTWVLLRFMRHFRWGHVGIISSAEESWIETAGKVAYDLRSYGFSVGIVVSVSNDTASMRQTLAEVENVQYLSGKCWFCSDHFLYFLCLL